MNILTYLRTCLSHGNVIVAPVSPLASAEPLDPCRGMQTSRIVLTTKKTTGHSRTLHNRKHTKTALARNQTLHRYTDGLALAVSWYFLALR